ncbi:MAG: restriction endonuclease subunit S [Gemmataceae bacterium]
MAVGKSPTTGRGTARTTAGIYKISQQDIEELQLPLPPLNEQQRIVAKVEELFSDLDVAVATLERVRAKLKRYRAAVLKAAIDGKLTTDWRARHPATEPASALLARILAERRRRWEDAQRAKFTAADKEPPKGWQAKYLEPTAPAATKSPLPEGWQGASLGQLLHGIEGGKSFKCLTREANPGEWGVIKVSAMTWGTFLEEENKAIPADATFDPAHEVLPGDLLLSRCNTTELVGASVLVGNCRSKLLLSDKSLRLLPSEAINRNWLHTALSSTVVRKQLSAMATGTSDSMRNVSQEKIESVMLPLPSLAEQAAIVEEVERRLSVVDHAAAQV